ncbi:GTP diphosphokinase RSH1, chloroplastic isoform X2 [Olea europaea subsp. europaea]|uniref:GTP diphosphokinase RSH1, chloroplastic isoform X2 n=1 Tax=Olea europaea subsp. europaea TaxID=158383 RepID=A0A8S0SCD0_OLEEU|nr:GTP diphosphokinase RSH1, chloroplastic isoform X2 [Olea europaea subsp. europaea]
MILANIPIYREVLPGIENWHVSKITSWHNLEGHSIQWFCIVYIDRRGITICSCDWQAEIDRGQGMGVMLFHVEASLDSLVNVCSGVDSILGVLGWSVGCSWPILMENQQFLEL